MGCIRWVHCEKLQRDFVGRTFVLTAPVQYVLQQVSCSYETIPNAPKYYETDWNISLGSNGVDWVRSLRKIPTWLCGTNFCINCTSSPRFAPSFMQLRNDNKCSQTLWNTTKHEFRVQWGGSGAFVAKNSDATSWHELLHLFGPFCIEFRKATEQSRMHINSMNTPKCQFRVQWGGSGAFVTKKSDATSWHELLH